MFKNAFSISVVTANSLSRNLRRIAAISFKFGGMFIKQSFKENVSGVSRQLQSYIMRIGVVVESFLKLVRTPLNVYFTAFKSSFLSLYAHINSDECHA